MVSDNREFAHLEKRENRLGQKRMRLFDVRKFDSSVC